MATIDSLDLATLTNNPQSIAEALEDVLETSSGNIGSLKTSAQTDHDHIEGLRSSAQSDHDDIEDFLGIATAEHYRWTSGFSNSWNSWDWTGANPTEQGIRVRRMGLLYIVDMSIYKGGFTSGTEITEKVLEMGTNINHPTNTVLLGLKQYVASATEYFFNPYITSDGHIYVRGYNSADEYFHVHGSFFGIDVS